MIKFCKEYKEEICSDLNVEICSCRFKIKGVYFYDFLMMIVDLMFDIEEKMERFTRFINLICEKNKIDFLNEDPTRKNIGKRINRIVSHIESGKIKLGDKVFCKGRMGEIILVGYPDLEDFEKYHREKAKTGISYFNGDFKVKSIESGQIWEEPAFCIYKVPKGNYNTEYKENGFYHVEYGEAKNRADILTIYVHRKKLRVERTKTKKGFLLRFFGNFQEEVDNFVDKCHSNDFKEYD